jgi:CheY-like chemotaxis protein
VDYLVRQQAGTVSAESAGLGKGATFSVEFPLTSSEVISSSAAVELFADNGQPALEVAESSTDEKLRDLRILIVEDDPDTQDLLRAMLQQHGAKVMTVGSVAKALKEISQEKPDVIISDIAMAGENGYEFIRKVRSLAPESGCHIPAIALTAYAGVADRRRALLAGFQTHLAKPIEPDDLLAVILSLTYQQDLGCGDKAEDVR